MSRPNATQQSDDVWDEVWADYDRRNMPLAPLAREPGSPIVHAVPVPSATTSVGLAAALVVALVALAAVHVTRSAVGTAASITSALASGDAEAIRASSPDWSEIRSGVDRDIGVATARLATTSTDTYLERMSSGVADAIATPEGLAGAAALRLAPPGPPGAMVPRVVVATGSLGADGLRFGLSPEGGPERVSVTVVPTISPPGWRVGTVRLLDPPPKE